MQSLDVISVNLWDIIISFANLVILFWLVKKFLYKPVQNILAKRQSEIDTQYESAEKANREAMENKESWENKISGAKDEADAIITDAAETAKYRGEKILEDAKLQAESIIRNAQTEAELEYKKAADGIKREIVSVSEAIAEKMLEREIDTENHRDLIDSFIEKIGDENGGNQ